MTEILILDEAKVRRLLDLDELLAALRQAFVLLSADETSVPPRVAAFTQRGLLAAMPGHVPNVGLGVKLVSVFDGNEARKLPSHQAVIMLFNPDTGTPLALMDGTYITAVRTAGSAAVAAMELAMPGSRTLAILGSGVQAKAHLTAFSHCFEFDEIRIAARNSVRAKALAAGNPRVSVHATFEEAARGADVICCCTNAEDPVLRREWVGPGAHVSSVGRGRELDAQTIAVGRVFVEWRGAAINKPPAGAEELQGIDPESVTEIGQVLAGKLPGRSTAAEITVYKSTGHAVEDIAAASLVYRQALAEAAGQQQTI